MPRALWRGIHRGITRAPDARDPLDLRHIRRAQNERDDARVIRIANSSIDQVLKAARGNRAIAFEDVLSARLERGRRICRLRLRLGASNVAFMWMNIAGNGDYDQIRQALHAGLESKFDSSQ